MLWKLNYWLYFGLGCKLKFMKKNTVEAEERFNNKDVVEENIYLSYSKKLQAHRFYATIYQDNLNNKYTLWIHKYA